MNEHTDRIVVGYDGSPQAGAALDWAATQAQQRRMPLHVMSVVDYVGMLPGSFPHSPGLSVFQEQASQMAATGVDRAKKIADAISVEPDIRVGSPAGVLVEASHEATMIVLGTRGHGAVSGAALGSVAFAVSAHAHCPVVVVRGDSNRSPGPGSAVVVGVDGSHGSDAALRYAADLAASNGAPLEIVTVFRTDSAPHWPAAAPYTGAEGSGPGVETLAEQGAHRVTGAALGIVRKIHDDLVVHEHVLQGHPATALSAAADSAALLVTGSRGRGGFTGLLLGSVGHGAIHTAPCPVVIVPGR